MTAFALPLRLLRGERRLMVRFAAASVARAALAACSVLLIRDFLGGALGRTAGVAGWVAAERGPGAALWMVAGLLLLTTLAMAALTYAARLAQHRLVAAVELGAMERLIRTLLRLSTPFFDRRSRGDLLHTLQRDVANLRTVVVGGATLLVDALQAAALIVAAVILSPQLSVYAFVLVPLGVAPVVWLAQRTMRQSYGVRRKGVALFDLFLQMLNGIRIIRIYQGESIEAERASGRARRYFDELLKMERGRAAARVTLESLAGLGVVVVIVAGGFRVLDGSLGWPELLAFLLAVRATHTPLHNLNLNLIEIQRHHASVAHIDALLQEQPEICDAPGARPLTAAPRTIAADRLSFGAGGVTILEDVSFVARAGETLGIVGPSGAGKTTLLNLLVRFYDPESGAVRWDAADVRSLQDESLHRAVALVAQDPFLFNTSVRENIRCGRPGASDADVEAAARLAGIHDEIQAMPEGYETLVGHGGRALSRGEAQRVNIARAVLKNAPVLLLDEATSSLDAHTEGEVQRALDRLASGRLTVSVTHRLANIRHASSIVVLDKGRVAGTGSHEALLRSCETYRRLWLAQAGEDLPPAPVFPSALLPS